MQKAPSKYVSISRLGQRKWQPKKYRVSAIKKRRRDRILSIITKSAFTIIPLAISFTPLGSIKWLRYAPIKSLIRLIKYIGW